MVRAECRSRPLTQRARLRQGPLAVDGGSPLAIRGACLLRAGGAFASAIYLIEVGAARVGAARGSRRSVPVAGQGVPHSRHALPAYLRAPVAVSRSLS